MKQEKKNFKERAKEFYENNKGVILLAGGTTAFVLMNLYGVKKYANGFMDGGAAGFFITMDYFDKNHGTNLKQIYEEFAKEHPEKMVDYKFKHK